MEELAIAHKFLRRKLKKYDTFETLRVIYSYFQNAYYNKDFPIDIVPHPAYVQNKQIVLFPSKSIIALREAILYCGYRASPQVKGIMQPANFGDFWDMLNNLNEKAYSLNSDSHDENRISFELYRMANQQFKWQSIFSNYEEYMNLYYFLFSDPELEEIIENTIGLKAIEYYAIGYLFLGNFINKFALKGDFSFIDDGFRDIVSKEKIDKFIEVFSIDIDELRAQILSKQKCDEGFEYHGIVDLLNTPLIQVSKLGEKYFCSPILPVFIKSLAEGIYFRCLRNRTAGMSGSFGSKFLFRFQKLCELNICGYLQGQNIKWGHDEELSRYDRPDDKGNDTDFFFTEDNGLLFLESKTKIIPESSYITAKESDFIKELNIWVEYLCQCYTTIQRYLHGDFQHCIDSGISSIYPIIVTPNDLFFWFATENCSIIGKIDKLLIEAYSNNGLDPKMIKKYPYVFLSIQQLPLFISLIDKHTIGQVMETFVKGKYRHYNVNQMAKEEFGINEHFRVLTEVNLSDEISRVVIGK